MIRKKYFILLILSIVFCLLGLTSCKISKKAFAEEAAKQIISNELKSPSSARWNEVSYMENDEYGQYVVYVDVEATNSFGAYIRNRFFVIVGNLNLLKKTFTYKVCPYIECMGKNDTFNLDILKNINAYGKEQETNNNEQQPQQVLVEFVSDGKIITSNNYNIGSKIQEISTPTKTNYTFLGWYIDELKIEFPYTVTSNTTFTAKWIGNECHYKLDGDENEYTVNYGQQAKIALPNKKDGYDFVGWYYNKIQITNSNGDIINSWDSSLIIILKAKFELITYHVIFTAAPGGTINEQIQITEDCSIINNYETNQVTAKADSGYRFDKWSDGLTSPTRKITNVKENKKVTALFIRCYELIFEAQDGGKIEGETNQIIDIDNTSSTVTAIPDEGYEFVRWEYTIKLQPTFYFWTDKISFQPNDLYSTKIVFTAIFKKLVYNIAYDSVYDSGNYWETKIYHVAKLKYNYSPNNGDTNPNGWSENGVDTAKFNISVDTNFEAPIITAVPEPGYRFVKWSDGNSSPTRHDVNIHENMKITAECTKILEVKFSATNGGMIEGEKHQIFDIDKTSSPVTAKANSGYEFVRWEFIDIYNRPFYFFNPTLTVDNSLYSNYTIFYVMEIKAIFKKSI